METTDQVGIRERPPHIRTLLYTLPYIFGEVLLSTDHCNRFATRPWQGHPNTLASIPLRRRGHPDRGSPPSQATSSAFSSNISFSHAAVASPMFPDLMFLRYIASIAGCKPITQATSSSFLTLIVMCSQPSLIWVLFNQVLLDLILNPANLSSSLMCVGILAFLPYCAQTLSLISNFTSLFTKYY